MADIEQNPPEGTLPNGSMSEDAMQRNVSVQGGDALTGSGEGSDLQAGSPQGGSRSGNEDQDPPAMSSSTGGYGGSTEANSGQVASEPQTFVDQTNVGQTDQSKAEQVRKDSMQAAEFVNNTGQGPGDTASHLGRGGDPVEGADRDDDAQAPTG
jgi:hypothetical protein